MMAFSCAWSVDEMPEGRTGSRSIGSHLRAITSWSEVNDASIGTESNGCACDPADPRGARRVRRSEAARPGAVTNYLLVQFSDALPEGSKKTKTCSRTLRRQVRLTGSAEIADLAGAHSALAN